MGSFFVFYTLRTTRKVPFANRLFYYFCPMKKLLLVISAAALSLSLSAQSLEWVNINPGTSVSGPNDQTFVPYAQIKNNSSNYLTVKVKRVNNNLATNHVSNFCFAGVCYLSTVSVSLFSVDIPPNSIADSTNGTLRADLNPGATNGISEVTYCAYDVDNEADSVCITFHYNAGPIGVNEIAAGLKFLSNAYPNPANQTSLVSYSLPFAKDPQLVISNMLGSTVNKISLVEKSGSVTMPVASLPEGVYYYTLMNDGKPVVSRRLMISHK